MKTPRGNTSLKFSMRNEQTTLSRLDLDTLRTTKLSKITDQKKLNEEYQALKILAGCEFDLGDLSLTDNTNKIMNDPWFRNIVEYKEP